MLKALTKLSARLNSTESDMLQWAMRDKRSWYATPRHAKCLARIVQHSVCNGDWKTLKLLHKHGLYTMQMANHQEMTACGGESDDMALAIHIAASRNYAGLVEFLIALKADVSKTNERGETALHLSAKQHSTKKSEGIIRALLKANPSIADAKDDAGQPPFPPRPRSSQ